MRIHVVWPTATIFGIGRITPESYLGLVTMHGTFMVFFVLTLAPQNAFGNYFLPLQIGANRMAFPGLNMAAFWLAFVSFLIMLTAFFAQGGAPISGHRNHHQAARSWNDLDAIAAALLGLVCDCISYTLSVFGPSGSGGHALHGPSLWHQLL